MENQYIANDHLDPSAAESCGEVCMHGEKGT